MGLEKIT